MATPTARHPAERETASLDNAKIRQAVAAILSAIGEDASREGLADTPRRVAEMYAEAFSGIGQDPAAVLASGFDDETHRELVLLRDIAFHSFCEHHLLPFFGSAHIGYIPAGRIAGVSKLARALDILARRPQVQERLTNALADAIHGALTPDGVAVVISAEHMCMTLRGVRKPGSKMITTAARGVLKYQPAARQEFFARLRQT